jgi:predicted nucleic acid-binding protein
MYLLDTNVISELRKQHKANTGVIQFFKTAQANNAELFLSVVTIGELRRGVDLIHHRGDIVQANFDVFLHQITAKYCKF